MKKKRTFVFPNELHAEDIKNARKRLNLTQQEFADFLCVSVKTVSKWEQNDTPVKGPVIPLISLLFEDRTIPEKYELPEQEYPVRLLYMYYDQCCTMIDVNEKDRIIRIKNFTALPMYRAFGTIDQPTFSQYLDFLESRCFPRTRDKMKLQLDELGLPFYDPFMIIEKTQGRMAEDHFWIKIVRKHYD
ncbi:MAG: helix-turn-helix domain-containing protein [Solobacterium sp.]|nr:helix-turn-helix domain-containing protein [Solobacterium sp.]